MEDRPLIISPRYRPLFDAIFYRSHDRVNVLAPTQDGKSVTIAAATLLVAITGERFTIVAPTEKKADIIMTYIREFAVDSPLIAPLLELDKDDNLDRLKRSRSRKHLTFKGGGGVQTLTLDARNSKRSLEAAMGFGAKNLIADEAGLIDDVLWATVMRMLGGDIKGSNRKKILIKIGNPFYRNHFYRSSQSKRYLQIFHDYHDSIRDYENGFYGYKPEYIEEMRQEPMFDVLYECTFPEGEIVDEKGYRSLITAKQINKGDFEPQGECILGVDVAAGGDFSTYIGRWPNGMKVLGFNKLKDTMQNIPEIERLVAENGISWHNVNIDDVGVGRGLSDRLRELGYSVNAVSAGGKSSDPEKYKNIRAEINWKLAIAIRKGLIVEECLVNRESVWDQLTWNRYKVSSEKHIQLLDKLSIKKEYGKSPDFADAAALTFYEPPKFGIL